jgi:hypothetical protein
MTSAWGAMTCRARGAHIWDIYLTRPADVRLHSGSRPLQASAHRLCKLLHAGSELRQAGPSVSRARGLRLGHGTPPAPPCARSERRFSRYPAPCACQPAHKRGKHAVCRVCCTVRMVQGCRMHALSVGGRSRALFFQNAGFRQRAQPRVRWPGAPQPKLCISAALSPARGRPRRAQDALAARSLRLGPRLLV